MKTFALIGAAGYIAPRHLQAIRDTGNTLVAALDPHDSVGILDGYFPDARFFTEFERFDRHVAKLARLGQRLDYVSIATPNYLHDAHVRFALRSGADAICEKPLVINPWNIDALAEIESETGRRINTILQLRLHPSVRALRDRIASAPEDGRRFDVTLDYVTSRGAWYGASWKGDERKSGGIVTNIGIHFFDMLTWVFGEAGEITVDQLDDTTARGAIAFPRADVRWMMSLDPANLPEACRARGQRTFRRISVDGDEVEFSDGFTDLHTESYREILEGRGFGLDDARASIELAHRIRLAEPGKGRP